MHRRERGRLDLGKDGSRRDERARDIVKPWEHRPGKSFVRAICPCPSGNPPSESVIMAIRRAAASEISGKFFGRRCHVAAMRKAIGAISKESSERLEMR
jgi:hypothetical protein